MPQQPELTDLPHSDSEVHSDHDHEIHDDVPDEEHADGADNPGLEYLDHGLDAVLWLLKTFVTAWQVAWVPGPFLVVDESMCQWEGGSAVFTEPICRASPLPLAWD